MAEWTSAALPQGNGRAVTDSATWVKLPVHGAQMLAVDMGVDLGGGDIGVPEHFLNRAQVRSSFEQVGGK